MKTVNYIGVGFLVLTMMVGACSKKSEQPVQNKKEPVQEETKKEDTKYRGVETVKDVKVTITYNVASDASVPDSFGDTVKKTEALLAIVLSSKDFRDELYKRNFADSAYGTMKNPCFNKVYGGTVAGCSIAGKAVYDNLFPATTINLTINIRNNGDNVTELGSAANCGSAIRTNDYWLKLNEKQLAYRLAKHWAHEYTHIRGYRHDTNVPVAYKWGNTNPEKDPAVGVHTIVGIVLDKWIAAKLINY